MRYLVSKSRGLRLTSHQWGGSGRPSYSEEDINKELKRRQGGYGRGARMKIESDRVDHIRGPSLDYEVRLPERDHLDHQKWLEIMNVRSKRKKNLRKITKPRPRSCRSSRKDQNTASMISKNSRVFFCSETTMQQWSYKRICS